MAFRWQLETNISAAERGFGPDWYIEAERRREEFNRTGPSSSVGSRVLELFEARGYFDALLPSPPYTVGDKFVRVGDQIVIQNGLGGGTVRPEAPTGGSPRMATGADTVSVGQTPSFTLEEAPPPPAPTQQDSGWGDDPPTTNGAGRRKMKADRAQKAASGQLRAATERAQVANTEAKKANTAAAAAVSAGAADAPALVAKAEVAQAKAKTAQDLADEASKKFEEEKNAEEEAARTADEKVKTDTPESSAFIVEPVYYEGASYSFSQEPENVVSQYSPYWVLIVVPFKTKVTASQKKINALVDDVKDANVSSDDVNTIQKAEESGGIIDLTNHCTSWRISHSKSSYVMNGSFTLVRPDVIGSDGKNTGVISYGTVNGVVEDVALQSIKTQDWVMFWAMDNEEDFERIRKAAVDGTGANDIVNDKKSGLKFVGKVKSFKTTQTIASNGVIMRKYFIDAQAFSEFDNIIYYSQLAVVSDNILSSKLGTLLQAFVLTPNSGLQVNTTQETIPFFTNLLFDMTLRDSLSQGLINGPEGLDKFLATQAPNGPCIIPAKVYDLLNYGKVKTVPVKPKTVISNNESGGQPIFYWPFSSKRDITSAFGSRKDPNESTRTAQHDGIDIRCEVGTPVLPSSSGTVIFAGEERGYGYVVKIEHPSNYITVYAHLSRIDTKVGKSATAGVAIGLSGGKKGDVGAGNSKGPHLHFEIRKSTRAMDPQSFSNIKNKSSYRDGGPVVVPSVAALPAAAPAAPPEKTKTSKIYTYVDILYQYIGILTKNTLTKNQTEEANHYYQTPIEVRTSVGNGYPLSYTNTFKVGEEMDSSLLVQTIHFDSRPIWQILKAYLNEPINEIFTSIRMNHEGRIFPTFICRQTPFSTKAFKADHKGSHKITQYVDIPKWYVPMSNVLTYDVGYSDGLNVNYLRLKLQSTVSDSTANQVDYMINVPPAIDSADIMRNGLRMYNVVTSSGVGNVAESQQQARFWTKLVADFVFRLKYQVNGHITCKGIQKPVSIGDNVIVNGVMFHIEGMTHEGAIDMAGKKRFNTTMSLTHGESLQSLGVTMSNGILISNPNI
jgi:murein DD-endopeptidase MepM/ murein hydrolase activator NlpD